MSLFPSLRIEFDKALTSQQKDEAVEKLRAIKGVLGVTYNAHVGRASLTYVGGPTVVDQVRAIPGLKVDTSHRY